MTDVSACPTEAVTNDKHGRCHRGKGQVSTLVEVKVSYSKQTKKSIGVRKTLFAQYTPKFKKKKFFYLFL